MKISELLIEAIVKTRQGPIIRAQNRLQIESSLIKSDWRELRAIVLPNQIWYVDSAYMVHYHMAEHLEKHTSVDLTGGMGVFIRDARVRLMHTYSLKPKYPIQGNLILTPADYGENNWEKINNYPIVKRFGLTVIL